jgi:hypothetical protein
MTIHMSDAEKYTPEEIAKFTESRAVEDAKLIKEGARYVPDEKTGDSVLRLADEQLEKLNHLESEKKKEKTELIGTIEIPDQTQELDFKKFLENPLFEKSYYLNMKWLDRDFKQLVYESSEPIGNMMGGTYKEAKIIREATEEDVIQELGIKPMSVDEWKYLFANLKHEQAHGRIFYLVQFEDGTTRTIKSELTTNGDGPYGYSLSFQKISSSTIRAQPFGSGPYTQLAPKVIFPTRE